MLATGVTLSDEVSNAMKAFGVEFLDQPDATVTHLLTDSVKRTGTKTMCSVGSNLSCIASVKCVFPIFGVSALSRQ